MFDTGVEAEIMEWAAALVDTGNAADIQLGTAVSLWVGVGMPNDRGVNQCVTACTMIAHSLSWLDREAQIVPVTLEIHDQDNARLAWSGQPEPQWAGAQWSGHCVLYLRGTQSLFDPTIGQIRPKGHQQPLLLDNLDPALLSPGTGCVSPIGNGHRVTYTTLDSQWHPNADPFAHQRHDHNRREMDRDLRADFVTNVQGYINSIAGR